MFAVAFATLIVTLMKHKSKQPTLTRAFALPSKAADCAAGCITGMFAYPRFILRRLHF